MFPGETVLTQSESERKNSHYSEFKVMKSLGSGLYYIGTMYLSCGNKECNECSDYLGEPKPKGFELDYNSRETDYFNTKEEAEAALEKYKATGLLDKQRY